MAMTLRDAKIIAKRLGFQIQQSRTGEKYPYKVYIHQPYKELTKSMDLKTLCGWLAGYECHFDQEGAKKPYTVIIEDKSKTIEEIDVMSLVVAHIILDNMTGPGKGIAVTIKRKGDPDGVVVAYQGM